jgi:hypothetical protein
MAVVTPGGLGLLTLQASRGSDAALVAAAENALRTEVHPTAQTLALDDETLRDEAERLAGVFAASFDQPFTRDPAAPNDIGPHAAARLRHGDRTLNLDFIAVDAFTAMTAGAATLLVRHDDDFLRISTSLRNEAGERTIGILLGSGHPARAALLAGRP